MSARLARHIARLEKQADRLSLIRVLTAFAAFAAAIPAFFVGSAVFWIAFFAAALGFIASVAVHRRFRSAIRRATFWQRFKTWNLARLALDWPHIPAPPDFHYPDHPFAADFDLTGARSVHHLLDTAVTAEGSLRLQNWLLALRPDLDTIARRQRQVRALTPRVIFREKLLLAASLASGRTTHDDDLVNWLHQPEPEPPRWALPLLSVLALANIFLTLFEAALGIPPAIRAVVFLAYFAIYTSQSRYFRAALGEGLALGAAFRGMQGVLLQLEKEANRSGDVLDGLLTPFRVPQRRPSAQIRRLNRVLAAAGVQGNPILWITLNLLVPWDLAVSIFMRRVKRGLDTALPAWLDAWHEAEALGSLANFAYLNPQAAFPIIAPDGPAFAGRALGHPLIPAAQKVRNDLTIATAGELILITGSNMAGKSSFLRTVGITCALAYTGGVVDADTLRLRPFRLFASMRVTDSVNDGVSYFYAEVRRLRALLDALESEDMFPLLYVIDEIFRGTNNRERLIGSRAYLRALVGKRGIGLVSTHDLDLVQLADEFPQIHNAHFREDVRNGEMQFDYLLREGPSPTTNALKIMALAGLPVEQDTPYSST